MVLTDTKPRGTRSSRLPRLWMPVGNIKVAHTFTPSHWLLPASNVGIKGFDPDVCMNA